ncbi:MAG TPA: NAD-dependent epimerase/dehydratase family protein [Polyangia bacterium]
MTAEARDARAPTDDDQRASGRGRLALVTGAAGVMGARLVRGLLDAGWAVRALVLPGDPLRTRLTGLGCDLREGDVSDRESLRGACDGVDTVFHLAAVIISPDPSVFQRVNRNGTAHLVREASAARVRHFIYVSSASVVYPRRTLYAESKLQAEKLVTDEHAFAHTIVRPTLVYEENGGQEFLMFLDYLRRFPVVPFIGDGRALKRPVLAADIVDGLLRLAGNARAFGKTYNFSGGEAISIGALAHLMLQHHGGDRRFVHLPVWFCRLAARLMALVMAKPPLTSNAIAGVVNDANLDPTEATHDLGYRPLGVHEGFSRCFSPVTAPSMIPGGSVQLSAQEGNGR